MNLSPDGLESQFRENAAQNRTKYRHTKQYGNSHLKGKSVAVYQIDGNFHGYLPTKCEIAFEITVPKAIKD